MGGKKPAGAAPSRGSHHHNSHRTGRHWSSTSESTPHHNHTSFSLWHDSPNIAVGLSDPHPHPQNNATSGDQRGLGLEGLSSFLGSSFSTPHVFPSPNLFPAQTTRTSSNLESKVSDLVAALSQHVQDEVRVQLHTKPGTQDIPAFPESGPMMTTCQCHSSDIMSRLLHLEAKAEAAESHIKVLQRQLAEQRAFGSIPQDPSEGDTKETLRKIGERLRTLEGRQGAMQSKIAALDGVLGRTGSAWTTTLKKNGLSFLPSDDQPPTTPTKSHPSTPSADSPELDSDSIQTTISRLCRELDQLKLSLRTVPLSDEQARSVQVMVEQTMVDNQQKMKQDLKLTVCRLTEVLNQSFPDLGIPKAMFDSDSADDPEAFGEEK